MMKILRKQRPNKASSQTNVRCVGQRERIWTTCLSIVVSQGVCGLNSLILGEKMECLEEGGPIFYPHHIMVWNYEWPRCCVFAIYWSNWMEINRRIFNDRFLMLDIIWEKAKFLELLWRKAYGLFKHYSMSVHSDRKNHILYPIRNTQMIVRDGVQFSKNRFF